MKYLVSSDPVGNFSSGTQDAIGIVICDTDSDLPAYDYFSGVNLYMGSKAHVIQTNKDYMLGSDGTWYEQPVVQATLDPSGYYTKTETVLAIGSALSLALAAYSTTTEMNTAIAASVYYSRGSQITATSDSHYDVEKMAPASGTADLRVGAWYFGKSAVPYMDNMPTSFPSAGGGNIRVIEDQGANRFIMEIIANSVAGSGTIWRRWYTASGWGSWYRFDGVVDV